MLHHPILRVVQTAGSDTEEWMKVFQDCLTHTDRGGLITLMMTHASPAMASRVGQSSDDVARMMKDSDKQVREIGIRCFAASRVARSSAARRL